MWQREFPKLATKNNKDNTNAVLTHLFRLRTNTKRSNTRYTYAHLLYCCQRGVKLCERLRVPLHWPMDASPGRRVVLEARLHSDPTVVLQTFTNGKVTLEEVCARASLTCIPCLACSSAGVPRSRSSAVYAWFLI